MLLSDGDIEAHLERRELEVTPTAPGALQPASLEVRLGDTFRVFTEHRWGFIDPEVEQPGLTEEVRVEAGGRFMLHPGEFVLASTVERVKVGGSISVRLEGKSSWGRLGLLVHATAGWIDPGFDGHVTLELSNVNSLPIALRPGRAIGQLCVFPLSSPARVLYGDRPVLGSRYQGQAGPTESRSWMGTGR
jgi:dCTP deaminase